MTNEIKEILKKIKSVSNFDDYVDFVGTEFKPLLEYITNLQKELEELREDRKNAELIIGTLQKENKTLQFTSKHNYELGKEIDKMGREYKSRIDKAIELIHKAMLDTEITGNGKLNLSDLYNILQESDKE